MDCRSPLDSHRLSSSSNSIIIQIPTAHQIPTHLHNIYPFETQFIGTCVGQRNHFPIAHPPVVHHPPPQRYTIVAFFTIAYHKQQQYLHRPLFGHGNIKNKISI